MTQTREMRRKEKSVSDPEEIRAILDKSAICRLGFSQGGTPYVLPLNYGYTYIDGVITVFIHGAGEGRKMDIIGQNPIVCFEIDCEQRLDPETNPNRYAFIWESIVGTGTVEFVTDLNEKKQIISNIINKYLKHNPHYHTEVTDVRIQGTTVLKLRLDEFKAKRIIHD